MYSQETDSLTADTFDERTSCRGWASTASLLNIANASRGFIAPRHSSLEIVACPSLTTSWSSLKLQSVLLAKFRLSSQLWLLILELYSSYRHSLFIVVDKCWSFDSTMSPADSSSPLGIRLRRKLQNISTRLYRYINGKNQSLQCCKLFRINDNRY